MLQAVRENGPSWTAGKISPCQRSGPMYHGVKTGWVRRDRNLDSTHRVLPHNLTRRWLVQQKEQVLFQMLDGRDRLIGNRDIIQRCKS